MFQERYGRLGHIALTFLLLSFALFESGLLFTPTALRAAFAARLLLQTGRRNADMRNLIFAVCNYGRGFQFLVPVFQWRQGGIYVGGMSCFVRLTVYILVCKISGGQETQRTDRGFARIICDDEQRQAVFSLYGDKTFHDVSR